MPSAEEIAEMKKEQLRKIMALPRKEKRSRLRIRQPWSSSSHGRVRSGVPTGQTPWFRMWMADLAARSALQSMKLDALAEGPSGKLASTFAILYVSGKIKNVWQLSQASVEDLLRIPQIGPARLELVEKYLISKNVPLKWTAV